MEIIKNTWFVGISTGIISGIVVFFFTKWIMDRKERVEYFKRVSNANQNIIETLKTYIAENGLPDIEVLVALNMSTARAFNVDVNEMYSISDYCEELIREIMRDVYVSNEKKKEYIDMLVKYKEKIKTINYVEQYQTLKMNDEKNRKQINADLPKIVAMLGMATGSFLGVNDWSKGIFHIINDDPMEWVPTFIYAIIVDFVLLYVGLEIVPKVRKNLRFRRH